jgi:hypothetical protein
VTFIFNRIGPAAGRKKTPAGIGVPRRQKEIMLKKRTALLRKLKDVFRRYQSPSVASCLRVRVGRKRYERRQLTEEPSAQVADDGLTLPAPLRRAAS